LVSQQRTQYRIHQFCLNQAISIKQRVIPLQKEVMIGAELATIRGERNDVDCSSVATERIT